VKLLTSVPLYDCKECTVTTLPLRELHVNQEQLIKYFWYIHILENNTLRTGTEMSIPKQKKNTSS